MGHAAEIGTYDANNQAVVLRVLVIDDEWFRKYLYDTVTDPVTGETVEVPKLVQATDPNTGALLFEEDGVTPIMIHDSIPEDRATGEARCAEEFGGVWKQTSYNGNFRKNYAGIGYVYDKVRDAFIAPKPFESWTLDEVTARWAPPVAAPADTYVEWDEELKAWHDPANRISAVDFILRFKNDEKDAAEASTDPTVVNLWKKLKRAPFVRLDSKTTRNGVQYLHTTGKRADGVTPIVETQARVDAILTP